MGRSPWNGLRYLVEGSRLPVRCHSGRGSNQGITGSEHSKRLDTAEPPGHENTARDTRLTLHSADMTPEPDLPPAAVDHVSSMLTLAKQKHDEAMAMVGTPDANALPRLRQVMQLLEEVEILAQDAASYVRSDIMAVALKELHHQQASIALAIERMENLPKPSQWTSPWPWVVMGMVMAAVAVSTVAG